MPFIFNIENHFEPTALHFVPTAPSVYSQTKSSIERLVQHDVATAAPKPITTTPPSYYPPVQENTRDQLNMSRIDQVIIITLSNCHNGNQYQFAVCLYVHIVLQ